MAKTFKILLDDEDMRGLRSELVRNCRDVLNGIDYCDFWVWSTLQALHIIATDQTDVPFHVELCEAAIVDIEDRVTEVLENLDNYEDMSSEATWISAVAKVTKSMNALIRTGGFNDYAKNIEFLTDHIEFTKYDFKSADFDDLLIRVDLE